MNERKVVVEVPYYLLDPEKVREHGVSGSLDLVAYGSYPCDWNGGRPFMGHDAVQLDRHYPARVEGRRLSHEYLRGIRQGQVKACVRELNSVGIPYLATMTNTMPCESDDRGEIHDFLGFLSGSDPGLPSRRNGVVVAHPQILEESRSEYGDSLRYVSSVIWLVTNPAGSASPYQSVFDAGFDNVTLRPEDVITEDREINREFFEGLTDEQMAKSIAFINYMCARDCGMARAHYHAISTHEKSREGYTYIIPGMSDSCRKDNSLALDQSQMVLLRSMGIGGFKVGRYYAAEKSWLTCFPGLHGLYRQ